jgi:hypothetical protein
MTGRERVHAIVPRRAIRLEEPVRQELLAGAQAVLDENWSGTSTVASRSLYPHQWSWDAGFIAIGSSWVEQQRAQQELETLFTGQWSNGMVPHIRFDPSVPADAYWPGPNFWKSERSGHAPAGVQTSGITQPPLHARAALEVYQHASNRDDALAFLRRMYPKLVAQHEYLQRWRDPAGHGLAVIVHPWESGLDNSPIWDGELASLHIPPGYLPPYKRFDLLHANAANRPSTADYDRYVFLAMRYRDSGYDDGELLEKDPFLVESPLFNAIYLWSTHALTDIAAILGEDPARHHAEAARIHEGMLAHLWHPQRQRFYSWDVRRQRFVMKDSIDSVMALLDPDLPTDQVEAIVDLLTSPHFNPPPTVRHYLIPSYDLDAPDFDRRRYWRGPVWINTDWLVARGLRQHRVPELMDEVEGSVIRLVRHSGFREYYDPFTGSGYGSQAFSWSAALMLDTLRSQPGQPP